MTIVRQTAFQTLALLAAVLLFPSQIRAWEQGGPTDDGYTEEPFFWSRTNPARDFDFGPVGVTGLVIDIKKGKVVTVRETTPSTPAAGKFRKGDILTAVNGKSFEGRDPQQVLGLALTDAEAGNGRLVFEVVTGKEKRDVAISIPVMGTYSATWPLKCAKSDRIIKEAVAYYGGDSFTKGKDFAAHNIEGALGCLFLLSTGDDVHLPKVKAYLAGTRVEGSNWINGYNGILCAEYFLRTGDKAVMPLLQNYCDTAKMRQKFNSGWNHGGTGFAPRYTSGGLMNAAGNQILTSLLMASECGANVDQETLLGGLRFLYRFAGRGTVPYGNHRGEGGLGSNGKDGMVAAAMHIATGARGDVSIYQKARDYLVMSILTSHPVIVQGHGDEGRGDAIWRSITSSYLLESEPKLYQDTMNRLRWWYDLSRRPSGAFGVSLTPSRFNTEGSGAALAMAFTASRKTLRITGAPRSPHARDFSLPSSLWGTPADQVFHSIKPIDRFMKLAPDEPIHRPFFRFGSAYSKPRFDAATIGKPEILKWIGHPNYLIRAQAAKALRVVGGAGEIEKLLADPDPRVRRAALDGWIDYNYWFGRGKDALTAGKITPGMLAAVRKMLADPAEAWWVVDGALMAMSFAPPEAVRDSLPLILPWTKHEEWWLRQSAFHALTAFSQNESLFHENLPSLIATLARESHTQPRQDMTQFFAKLLRQNQNNETGRRIIDGLLKAAENTTILPDKDGNLRSIEGRFNVYLTLEAAALQAPESEAIRVARAVVANFDAVSTPDLVNLVATPNHNPEKGKSPGIHPALARLPDNVSVELKKLLENEFLNEFKQRVKDDRVNASLLDTVADLARMAAPGNGWQPIDTTPPSDRVWRFTPFDLPDNTISGRTAGGLAYDPKLPSIYQDWQSPDYDDKAWSRGPAPIGSGLFKWKNSPTVFENRSQWGEGEFLLARADFKRDDRDFAAYRLRILAPRAYQVFLNGKLLHQYVWYKDTPQYAPIIFDEKQMKLLKTGTNTLAIYLNRTGHRGPAQMDALIEGLVLDSK